MGKSKASGITLSNKDASIVLGMDARGDRDHDIAGWFGVNQGRIAEVKQGSHGSISAAAPEDLPPKGPPGLKGRRLRGQVEDAISKLQSGDAKAALAELEDARKRFDGHEG